MLKRLAVPGALLALVFSVVTFYACGGGDNLPTANTAVSAAPASTSGAQATTTPKATPDEIKVETVSSTFDADRCTQLSEPQYAGKTELVEVSKITNNTKRDVYPKPAIYHSKKAGCGALDTNPGGISGLVEGENIAPGASGVWTQRFTIPEEKDLCGAWQFDNAAMNGELSAFVLGKVINSGVDCPSCEAINVNLSISGEGLTRTVSVTFKDGMKSKKATVDFGDGTSAQVLNGGSVTHTWPYGSFVVTATLEAYELSCAKSSTVENKKPCDKYTELVLKADSDRPDHGESIFKYHVMREVPGWGVLNDVQIWEDELAKGAVKHLKVPDNGDKYYAFYDADPRTVTDTVTATCSDVTAATIFNPYDPKLWFECGCRGDK